MLPVDRHSVRLLSNNSDYLSLIPENIQLGRAIWKSEFKINHRIASKFHDGRVFLAGDAAHIHSPAGGRGMNIGIEDVYVLSKLMKQGLQGEYTDMRKPILEKMVHRIEKLTDSFLSGKKNMVFSTYRTLPLLPSSSSADR